MAGTQNSPQRRDWRKCPGYKELSWKKVLGRRKVLVNILKKCSMARLCGIKWILERCEKARCELTQGQN